MNNHKARRIPSPPKSDLQVSFYFRLQSLRGLYLLDAMRTTVAGLSVGILDAELAARVKPEGLARVASFGIRGEIFFGIPAVLRANPYLLGYYRLLLGASQKELYNKGGFGRFKRLEEMGTIPDTLSASDLDALSSALIAGSETLIENIDDLSLNIVHDLQLLTLGPQLRGGENTRIGQRATQEVFNLIAQIAGAYVLEKTLRMVLLKNDSGRPVSIEFFSDPDIRVTEKLESQTRPIISIEIKGGGDASNVHNRIGEAEKSHQKAKNRGFFEFWTILRANVDEEDAKRESPTTTQFFHLPKIKDSSTQEYRRFRDMLCSRLGIGAADRRRRKGN